MNMSTIIVAAVLAVVVGFVVYRQVKNHREGKHCCGGDCSSCPKCAGKEK